MSLVAERFDARRTEAYRMRLSGCSLSEVGRSFGVSAEAVAQWAPQHREQGELAANSWGPSGGAGRNLATPLTFLARMFREICPTRSLVCCKAHRPMPLYVRMRDGCGLLLKSFLERVRQLQASVNKTLFTHWSCG